MVVTVDLSNRRVKCSPAPADMVRKYLGGRGLAAALIASMGPRPMDAFAPRAPVVFAPGFLTGSGAPSSARWAVSAKSPASGLVSAGNGGGFFGARMAWCGVRALVIVGRASEPVLIRIAARERTGAALGTRDITPDVEVIPCGDLWGMDTRQAQREAAARWGRGGAVSFASIGPAGERLVPLANIIADGARAAGRGGLGAVLGSKNLKGVLVEAAEPAWAASTRESRRCSEFNHAFRETSYYETHSRWGTINALKKYNRDGGLAVKNGLAGCFPGVDLLSGERFEREFKTSSRACYACPLPCGNTFEIRRGPHAGTTGEAASASTVKEFGARCGIAEMPAVLAAHSLADRLGLDMISLAGTLSFGMECSERGLLDRFMDKEPDLRFGCSGSMIETIHLIAGGEGIGGILGLGVRSASRVVGGGSRRFALHVKGLETPATDPRAYPSWGLAYAVSSRGACHMRAFPVFETGCLSPGESARIAGVGTLGRRGTTEGRGAEVSFFEDMRAISDSLGVCKFIFRDTLAFFGEQARWLDGAAAGMGPEELRMVGERVVNLERVMNLEDGLKPESDSLPERFTEDPIPDGPSSGWVCDIDRLVEDYYAARDWDAVTGGPSRAVLERLGLDPVD